VDAFAPTFARWLLRFALVLISNAAWAGPGTNFLYPDIFPFVEEDAPSNLKTLQNWQLSGDRIQFNTIYANQGDGLFEIRQGANIDADRYELLQRVYIDDDFGSVFEDLSIGTAPIPGTAGSPNPNDTNVIWLEEFSKFSLHEAPVVDGLLTFGDEVAQTVKTSWRLSANRGPLPGYPANIPRYGSSDQTVQQRISVGWGDLYSAGSGQGAGGQFINIANVPLGPRYWLQQTVDPENRIRETDETNNAYAVLIDLNQPGEAIMFASQFVQPGDPSPAAPGDLNEDGLINIDDWLAFKAGANTDLAGLDAADAYVLGDLDLDGAHSIDDVVLFRQFYDDAHGRGAFATIQAVPEPSTLLICGIGIAALSIGCGRGRRHGRNTFFTCLTLCAFMFSSLTPEAAMGLTLFSEDFDSLPLGSNVDEGQSANNVWTATPPDDWSIDNADLPSGGVTEWAGWAFADRDWWSSVAQDQQRSQFNKASGAIAVADPDEWDDVVHDAGTYNTFLETPTISLAGQAPGSVQLRFDSSWRRENDQTANLTVSYDGGPESELFRWTSVSGPNFKPDATNETVVLSLDNPAGASNMRFNFGMFDAGNNWWWAIDNIEVFTPTMLQVDTGTGEMSIVGAEDITGYEITGPANSLDGALWQAGNLDAQNIGPAVPLTTDVDNSHAVDGGDLAAWATAYGGGGADVDGDGDSDGADFLQIHRQLGESLAGGESWETLIAADDQLLEFFLLGSSSFGSQPIGAGYNTAIGAQNLSFSYTDSNGQKFAGAIAYVSNSSAAAAVPEPSTALLTIFFSMPIALGVTGRRPLCS